MSRFIYLAVVAMLACQSQAAEKWFDFDGMPTNQPPTNCFSMLAGEGKPGTWKVLADDVPLPLAPVTKDAPATMKKNVAAQTARDNTDEHFPMLLLGKEKYGDFTLKTKFKIVDGLTEQMAGIVFHYQDEKNFFVVRASALGTNIAFYKVENGLRGPLITQHTEIKTGVWHDLAIECRTTDVRARKSTEIHIILNGVAFPGFDDPTFMSGKIGYWTKSDSISYFTDTRITYAAKDPLVLRMVRDTMKEFPRLVGVQVYVMPPQSKETQILASSNEKEIGQPGGKHEADVIENGTPYFNKEKDIVSVMLPLRDRNGDVQAAVRIRMKSFPGQTEENAFVRATPIIKAMQEQVVTVDNIMD